MRRCVIFLGFNPSVEGGGKVFYAELKISCKVFDVVVRSSVSIRADGCHCAALGMRFCGRVMCKCVHLLSYELSGCRRTTFVWCCAVPSYGFLSSSVGHFSVCQHFVRDEKMRNCLKISAKYFVHSDFLRIFARFLCALRPRVREYWEVEVGCKVLKVRILKMQNKA